MQVSVKTIMLRNWCKPKRSDVGGMKDWTKKKKTGLRHPGWVTLLVSPWVLYNCVLVFSLSFFVSFYGGKWFLHIFLIAMFIMVYLSWFLLNTIFCRVWWNPCDFWHSLLSEPHEITDLWMFPLIIEYSDLGVYLRRSYWTFRYFKVNHFETIERNICRWLNKLFIVCVCVCDRLLHGRCQGFNSFFQTFWFFHMMFYDERLIIALLWLKSNF